MNVSSNGNYNVNGAIVKVNVQPNLQNFNELFINNGNFEFNPVDSDGYKKVKCSISVQPEVQGNQLVKNYTLVEDGNQYIIPDDGYNSMSAVNLVYNVPSDIYIVKISYWRGEFNHSTDNNGMSYCISELSEFEEIDAREHITYTCPQGYVDILIGYVVFKEWYYDGIHTEPQVRIYYKKGVVYISAQDGPVKYYTLRKTRRFRFLNKFVGELYSPFSVRYSDVSLISNKNIMLPSFSATAQKYRIGHPFFANSFIRQIFEDYYHFVWESVDSEDFFINDEFADFVYLDDSEDSSL